MSISICQRGILYRVVLLSVVLSCLYTASNIVSAEEVDTKIKADASTSEQTYTSKVPPYAVESLLGDEVYGDFVVGPGKVELEIKPGESKIVEITVSNRSGISRVFEISTEDATGSNDPSQTIMLLGDDRGPYSMKDYVFIKTKRFELEQNQRARIPVTISVPANAEAGGLYGSILVSTVSSEARKGDGQGTASQSAVVARIGSLFFITIPGVVQKEGNLKDFSTIPKKIFFQSGPINLGLLFENKGSIHLVPSGELRVKNIFDEEVGFLQLDPWFVMPKSLRLREISWNRDFLFGRYTAMVTVSRGYDNLTDEMSYSFWVLPWKPLIGSFAVLFAIFFVIRAFFRKFEFKRKS